MSADVIRVYKSVHTWTGVISGMVLFIAFYAGALTVFKEPLTRWATPPAREEAAVPIDDARALVSRALKAGPAAARDFSLRLSRDERNAVFARLEWSERPQGGAEHPDALAERRFTAVPRSDGGVRVEEVERSKVGEFIDTLHRVGGLPRDTDENRWFMGVVSVLYALALISGIVLIAPTLTRDVFALRLGAGLKRGLRDAHNLVGFLSLPFHVIMALTAVAFAFHDGIYLVQDKLIHNGGLSAIWSAARPATAATAPRDPAAMAAPADLIARARALSDTFQVERLQYLNVTSPRAAVVVWGRDDGALATRATGGFVLLDPHDGHVIGADYLPGRQSVGQTVVSAVFSLHFGSFGGAPVKWIYFLLGMGGAWLFYGGNLLWIENRRKPRGDGSVDQRRAAEFMSSLTAGVCLGAICGISLTLAAAKPLRGVADDLVLAHQLIHYAVFFSSIVWAFLRGGTRASIDLLWTAAAFTALIPLTTVFGLVAPSTGLWAHTDLVALSVDGTATALALAFAGTARAAARRPARSDEGITSARK